MFAFSPSGPFTVFYTVATAALDRPLCSNNMATTFYIEANNQILHLSVI